MKFLTRYKIVLFMMLFLGITISCDKSLETGEQFAPLLPVALDEDANTWDMIVLPAVDQIVVAAPTDPGSDAYKAELTAVKTAQAGLTQEQRDIIAFWSVGGVVRWNQIMRDLVSRFNLPPAPRADGTYPAPDAENPFADPNFPFANPPYAARAYSYVSVGMYEALKAAWHYKYLYNRAAPYDQDDAIQALVPETDLPAYPSEDAVMSGVAVEMMSLLFPVAEGEIRTHAANQRNAALWSGKAVKSDIDAGYKLGKDVAVYIIDNRAKKDGMSTAAGNPALWKQLEENVGFGNMSQSGQQPWISLESPKRPPMLPNFSKVWAWNMSAEDIANERPVAPPSTSSAEMQKEVDEVKWFSQNLTRERLAIVHKWADGVGTYTPPGHWNDIATEYIVNARFSEVRTARAYALLNMAMHDAAVACWETKFYYFNPRPSQLNPSIKTVTGVPNFPAFTSGHSNFSGSAATVLSHLFPEESEYFNNEAFEASMSRLYGAIHYRSDVEVGLDQGKTVGGYTVQYALTDGAE